MPFGTVSDATRNNEANRKLAKGVKSRNFRRGRRKVSQHSGKSDTTEPLQFGSHGDLRRRKLRLRRILFLFILGLAALSISAILLLD